LKGEYEKSGPEVEVVAIRIYRPVKSTSQCSNSVQKTKRNPGEYMVGTNFVKDKIAT
jgi:hypothetical protein